VCKFEATCSCGAHEAFLEIHERQERRKNPFLHFVGKRRTQHRDAGKFFRGGSHIDADFRLAVCAASSGDRLAAHRGANFFHTQSEVKRAQTFGGEFVRHRRMTSG